MVSGQETERLTRRMPMILALLGMALAGVLMGAAGQALFPTEWVAFIQMLCLSVAFALLQHHPLQRAWGLAWCFATAWLISTFWWLFISLNTYGHLPAWLAALAVSLLAGALALYYAFVLVWHRRYTSKTSNAMRVLSFAACWTLAELARAEWFTGFPWGAVGYLHVDGLLSYAAPWVGVYGVGALAAAIASWLALEAMQLNMNTHPEHEKEKNSNLKQKWVPLFWVLLATFMACLPSCRNEPSSGESLRVNLLQANVAQDVKFGRARVESAQWYLDQMRESKAELTVLPETAITWVRHDLPPGLWEALQAPFAEDKKVAIVGMPTWALEKGFANSALGLGFSEPMQYDKHHLVPFGEFTPPAAKWFTRMLNLEYGDFHRGALDQPAFVWGHHRFGITICYEDLFGEELAARFLNPNSKPSVFVNLSNIAWFGNTPVVDQHLAIARMRSLEFERPTLRATNTGGTAIIDAQGRITHQLEPFTQGALQGMVKVGDDHVTPYAQWAGRWGLWPLWLLCLAVCAWVWRTQKSV